MTFTFTFVNKVVSLLFKPLSRFVIAFLPRSKCLLTAWLPSSSAVVLACKSKGQGRVDQGQEDIS